MSGSLVLSLTLSCILQLPFPLTIVSLIHTVPVQGTKPAWTALRFYATEDVLLV